jgi:ribosomal peptide maturation radical SAM protein 1
MPFAAVERPSLALSLLEPALANMQIATEIRYLNFDFASHIGRSRYDEITNSDPTCLIGEWIFADDLFEDKLPPPLEYFSNVVAGGALDIEFDELLSLREAATAFLDDCIEMIDWEEVLVLGFTSSFQQNVASLALAKRVKQRHPSVAIVFGGANCEGEMGGALHRLFPFVDYVCLGEGEIALPALARQLLSGRRDEIPGMLGTGLGPAQRRFFPPPPIANLDMLPIPNFEHYVRAWEAANGRSDLRPQLLFESARGCWWGQKSHCTFCGLNGDRMPFRAKSTQRILEEIEWLIERYDVEHFQVVDNIMDMRHFKELLPILADRDLGVTFFFEVKANLRRDQVAALADAGVTHIQPGIESLSTAVLRRMRKGVTMLQNVQLLRWCAELGVQPHWNLLAGFPGEEAAEYERQAELIPLLTHLPPPSGLGMLSLQRFSPLFERPLEYEVHNIRAARAYRSVYPFSPADLSSLAYCFEFDYADARSPCVYLHDLRREVERWVNSEDRGELRSHEEGDALVIRDTRPIAAREEYHLRGARRAVYEYCDRAQTEAAVEEHLVSRASLGTAVDVVEILAELVAAKLLLDEDGRYLSLAVPFDPRRIVRQFSREMKLPRLYELWAAPRFSPAQ